jgi:nucleoside-diphosphate-sugar epimerase
MPARILVTGGAGFIGSHLCAALLDQGHEVLCVDNYVAGLRSNIEPLLDNRRFEALRHDIPFPLYVEVDQIYNLACPASPRHYPSDPVQTLKTSQRSLRRSGGSSTARGLPGQCQHARSAILLKTGAKPRGHRKPC